MSNSRSSDSSPTQFSDLLEGIIASAPATVSSPAKTGDGNGSSEESRPPADQVTVSKTSQALSTLGLARHMSMDDLWMKKVAETRLSPQIQEYAGIINDDTGEYGIDEKISAYNTVIDGFGAMSAGNAYTVEDILQNNKFLAAIADSDFGKIVADARKKMDTFHGDLQLWAALTDVQRQLTDFRMVGVREAGLWKTLEESLKQAQELVERWIPDALDGHLPPGTPQTDAKADEPASGTSSESTG